MSQDDLASKAELLKANGKFTIKVDGVDGEVELDDKLVKNRTKNKG